MHNTSMKVLGPLFICAIFLTACAPAASELVGSNWSLVSLDGNTQVGEALGGQPVTLGFTSSTEAGGSGGCNSFGAKYQASSSGSIAFSEIVSTLMACTQEGVGDVEAAYFVALSSANHYEIVLCEACANPETLTITGSGHTLVFAKFNSFPFRPSSP